jgi:hypothetical protein
MKTSADFTRDILLNKTHCDIAEGDNFIPFLVQKYLSGVSPEHCSLINDILNMKLNVWCDDQEVYDFLKCFIPKKKGCYFKYFGKSSDKKPSKIDMQALAASLEIPTREALDMLKYFPQLEKNLIEEKEKILKAA